MGGRRAGRAVCPGTEAGRCGGLAPAADVSGLVAKAGADAMTTDQAPPWRRSWNPWHACTPTSTATTTGGGGGEVLGYAASGVPSGPRDRDRPPCRRDSARTNWRRRLRRRRTGSGSCATWALPQRPLSAPLSVAYGDQDTSSMRSGPPDALAEAVPAGRQCALGPAARQGARESGHQRPGTWLADRFPGKEAPSDCLGRNPDGDGSLWTGW